MSSTRRILYWGLARPVGIFACLSLNAPVQAVAGDAQNSQLPALAMARPHGSASIASLLAKLEQLIAADDQGARQKNDQADTIADILVLLPNAPPSDVKLLLSTPSRFANRAREAEAAGRDDAAGRFAALADVLAGLLRGKTPVDTAESQTDPQPQTEAPPDTAWSNRTTMVAPPVAPAPGDADNARNALDRDAFAQAAPMTSTPGPEVVQTDRPAGFAGPLSNNHRNFAPDDVVSSDLRNSQTPVLKMARPQRSASIPALLAKLEQQIVADYQATPGNNDAADTIADILLLLSNAPPSDANLVLATPSRFANRAREAEAAGRHDEASRFAALADVLGGLLGIKTSDDPVGQRTAEPPEAQPPIATPTGNPAVATAVVPDGSDSLDHASGGDTLARAAPTTSPLSPAPTPPPVELVGRSTSEGPLDAAQSDGLASNPRDSQPPAPAPARPPGPFSITALLATLEQQIAANHEATIEESDTIADILLLLPNAPPSDAKLVLATPMHFANRAREAEAAGRGDEAVRFAALADILRDLLHANTPTDDGGSQTSRQPEVEPPTETARGGTAIATAPVAGNPDSVHHASNHDASAPVAPAAVASTPPLDLAATQNQPPAELAGRASNGHLGMAVEPKIAAEPTLTTAIPPPPNTAKSDPPTNLAATPLPPTETAKPQPASESLKVARLTDSDAKLSLSGILSAPVPAAHSRPLPKAPVTPVISRPRVTTPPSTKFTAATANIVDPQCRAILLKFSIGEEPSDAERSYLRNGCRPHG
jgi:hypothetical protein